MEQNQPKTKSKDWICRTLLTLLLIRTLSGYTAIWQADYQLVSPLIPKSMVYEIAFYWIKPCLALGLSLLVSLWLYFLEKKTAMIVVSAVSIIAFEIRMRYFIA